MYAPPPIEKNPEQRIFTMALYVIASLAAILQYAASVSMVVTGCIMIMLTGFMVKMQRVTAKGTIYESHVEWTARTLSIGSKFLFPGAIIVALYLIYTGTDIAGLKAKLDAANESDAGNGGSVLQLWIAQNWDAIDSIITWCLSVPIFWWVRRCWVGLMKADKHEPIDYPEGIL